MLYISRYIDHRLGLRYGVVDTDDGAEQVCDVSDLYQAVQNNVPIAGVEVFEGNGRRVCNRGKVYQHKDYVTKKQQKLFMLTGVQLILWRNMITEISWDGFKLANPVSVRLSEFAPLCADHLLLDQKVSNGPRVTLVLDDNLKWTVTSFLPHQSAGADFDIIYDIRDCSDSSYINSIYNTLWVRRNNSIDVFSHVIDRPERFNKLRSNLLLYGVS